MAHAEYVGDDRQGSHEEDEDSLLTPSEVTAEPSRADGSEASFETAFNFMPLTSLLRTSSPSRAVKDDQRGLFSTIVPTAPARPVQGVQLAQPTPVGLQRGQTPMSQAASPAAAARPLAQEDATQIRVIVRPTDVNGWVMGEDMPVLVSEVKSFKSLMRAVCQIKGIHPSRQVWTDVIKKKQIDQLSHFKTLRALGIRRDTLLELRPTYERAWAWESVEFYEARMIEAITIAVNGVAPQPLLVERLNEKVLLPPPLQERGSLRAFFRKWPELFHLEHRRGTGEIYVRMMKSYDDVPTWI